MRLDYKMKSSDDDDELTEIEANTSHEDLPQGSERDIIQQYFYRGLLYRQIILMLEKKSQHQYD